MTCHTHSDIGMYAALPTQPLQPRHYEDVVHCVMLEGCYTVAITEEQSKEKLQDVAAIHVGLGLRLWDKGRSGIQHRGLMSSKRWHDKVV